ncbi:hypothetical protein ABI_16180 [Asticcacaulis biprosthecium C19]|uniref:Uncharacterized protein n=1 Tax=Asticcacaulis biprosthecium C19 TaxID=715226 RepID=F4QJS1_9CAUL|nr:hypothetical protein ABI_16180 [Asticcacaulis biprosthecium C19]
MIILTQRDFALQHKRRIRVDEPQFPDDRPCVAKEGRTEILAETANGGVLQRT